MKYSLSVIIMIILLTACHRSPQRLPSGWQATGNAEADTLTERLDRDYGHNAGSGADQWIAPLESIARANPENVRIDSMFVAQFEKCKNAPQKSGIRKRFVFLNL